jgi:hypothetical protein
MKKFIYLLLSHGYCKFFLLSLFLQWVVNANKKVFYPEYIEVGKLLSCVFNSLNQRSFRKTGGIKSGWKRLGFLTFLWLLYKDSVFNGITVNFISYFLGYNFKSRITLYYCIKQSVNVIIWLMWSNMVCPKVISLSGAYCTMLQPNEIVPHWNTYLTLFPKRQRVFWN